MINGFAAIAIKSAKVRAYERIHCPLLSLTINADQCKDRKANNPLGCLGCYDIFTKRKNYIQSLMNLKKETA